MPIQNLIGLIALVGLLIWFIYSLSYWTNLAWRLPEKLRETTINKVKSLPNSFPLKEAVLESAERQSIWLVRVITVIADAVFIPMLLLSIYAIVRFIGGWK